MIAKFFSRGRKQHARRAREIARRQTAERQRSYGGERLEGRQLLANTVGLITNNVAEAFGGYTLFAPSLSTTTYLIDQEGHEVNRWTSGSTPMTAELLPDGSLIRAGRVATQVGPNKAWAPGTSGRIEKFNWDGDLVWSYTLATQDAHLHHDLRRGGGRRSGSQRRADRPGHRRRARALARHADRGPAQPAGRRPDLR